MHSTSDLTMIEKRNVWTIDVAIPVDSIIEDKELEMITKHQDLKIERFSYIAHNGITAWSQWLLVHWVPYQMPWITFRKSAHCTLTAR